MQNRNDKGEIELQNLTKVFGDVTAVDNANVRIKAESFFHYWDLPVVGKQRPWLS
jgi:hypothetical protein